MLILLKEALQRGIARRRAETACIDDADRPGGHYIFGDCFRWACHVRRRWKMFKNRIQRRFAPGTRNPNWHRGL